MDNPFDLTGKVAVVTGGNGGIGLGFAEGLARAGASIAVAARDQDKMGEAVRVLERLGGAAFAVSIDVAEKGSVVEAINAVLDRVGRLDILVNNAGIGIRKQPQDFTPEEWDQVVDVNLKGAFLCSQAAYRPMSAQGGGKIINIGSMTSVFGLDWAAPYAASKGGIVQLTKTLAVAWAKDNIQVNTVLPGWINTELTAPIKSRFPERHAHVSSRIPAGRWGEPADFAGIATFLAGSASDYVTGATIPVDGGYTSY